jgi:hypothetical protein
MLTPKVRSLQREEKLYASTPSPAHVFWIEADASQNPTVVTRDEFPQRRPHPNLGDEFVSLSSIAQSRDRYALSPSSASTPRSNSNLRPARLLSEVGSPPRFVLLDFY